MFAISRKNDGNNLIQTGVHKDAIVIKQGYLEKESLYLKRFRKRWIVLKNDKKIYSYKNNQMESNPTEIIDLKYCQNIIPSNKNNSNEFILVVNGTQRSFIAKSTDDRNDWIKWILHIKNKKDNDKQRRRK